MTTISLKVNYITLFSVCSLASLACLFNTYISQAKQNSRLCIVAGMKTLPNREREEVYKYISLFQAHYINKNLNQARHIYSKESNEY
jgi:hypothetical protein